MALQSGDDTSRPLQLSFQPCPSLPTQRIYHLSILFLHLLDSKCSRPEIWAATMGTPAKIYSLCILSLGLVTEASPLNPRPECQMNNCLKHVWGSNDKDAIYCDKAVPGSGQDPSQDINCPFTAAGAVKVVSVSVQCQHCNIIAQCAVDDSAPPGSATVS